MEYGPALVIGEEIFPLSGGTDILGRRDRTTGFVPDVDLTDCDDAHSISRRHADVSFRGGHPLFRDLNSVNGSTINGAMLQAEVPYPLRDGDALGIGDVVAQFALSAPWPDRFAPEPESSTFVPPVPPTASWETYGPGPDCVDPTLMASTPLPEARFCERCGEQRLPGARYCGRCGNALS